MRKYSLWIASLAILAVPIAVLVVYMQLMIPPKLSHPVSIKVEHGDGMNIVAVKLKNSGVIRSSLVIKILARWQPQGGKIQAGSYRFSTPTTPLAVLNRLVVGDVEKVSLTLPEGFTLRQIIERMSAKGFGQKDKLLKLAYSPAFLKTLNIEATSLEGYLFPETYLFAPGVGEEQLFAMMVKQLRGHIDAELQGQAAKLGLSLHQWLTLASIIEKETGIVAEMPLISSVFHNRMQRNIPLQTDPTVIYGIKDYDGNITRKHLRTPTPYNTYLIRGLPPGPIASPGLAAIKAAVQPAQSKYLYFVASGDGGHKFSKTLREHNVAVQEYLAQRRRSR